MIAYSYLREEGIGENIRLGILCNISLIEQIQHTSDTTMMKAAAILYVYDGVLRIVR